MNIPALVAVALLLEHDTLPSQHPLCLLIARTILGLAHFGHRFPPRKKLWQF